ncbi:SusC/RagA family TonB-linked outer membrane protein [Abyssalbus ytuae]|uniref:TonB-dependent receptor n=1 Tax=Abyssalbus ytuae TaxID=2926907 RepID=A0A9E7CSC2_9FLAO|nr:TonB-dependent receptor [Abyssalbus ytuae]UOB16046.1 TonB-dependent receptor [Abyssalbus ytuae]
MKNKIKYLFLFLLGVVFSAQGQEKTITGIVTDDEGIPLPGATVLVKGTNTGTTTDFDGNFSIETSKGSILAISYVGYTASEVVIDNQNSLTVVLKQTLSQLDEVIIVGYGTTRKKDLTGAVTSITTKDFNKGPVVGIESLIQGRAAGVQISTASAEPGGDVLVRIRGNNSINSNNSPLYVVDGFPMSGLDNSINPSDIKSVNILKDASAAAIYGSRGANGVIIITTKRGVEGKSSITLDSNSSFQIVDIDAYDFLGGVEYAELKNRIFADNGSIGEIPYTPEAVDRIRALGLGTNWLDEAFRTGRTENHIVSVSGGNENTKIFLSGGLFQLEGAVKNTDFSRYTLRMNLDQKLLDGKMKVGLNTSLTNTITNFQGFSASSLQDNILRGIFRANPIVPTENVYNTLSDEDRQLIFSGSKPSSPIETLFIAKNESNRYFVLTNAYLEYNIIKDLTFKTTAGARISNSIIKRFLPSTSTLVASSIEPGQALISHDLGRYYIFENTLNYNKEFGNHSVNALFGLTKEWNRPESFSASAKDFTTDALEFNSLQSGATPLPPSSSSIKREIASLIARLNYSYKDKYLLTFTYRRDGSSAVGANNQWGNFPAAAIAWKLHNEDFLKSSKISTLKLRVSHGTLGNARLNFAVSQTAFAATEKVTTNGTDLSVGTIPARIGNNNLLWEKTTQSDLGIELGLFNDKLFFELGAYSKSTTDLLLNKTVASSLGIPDNKIFVNAGEVENRGLEFAITSNNISTPNFSWTTNLNFGYNENEIKKVILPEGATNLPGDIAQIDGDLRGSYTVIQEGLPISAIYGYRFLGILQDGEAAPAHQPNLLPGDPKFADINGDGSFSSEDKEVIGQGFPKYTFGLTNSFSYKNFDLSIFISGVLDVDKINGNNIIGFKDNTLELAKGRWGPSNPNGILPQRGWKNDEWVNDLYVENSSYVRIKNISLAYNLDTKKANLPWISALQIYANATNLITWTDYSGFDPEVNSRRFGDTNLNSNAGLDAYSYPNTKTVSIGLKLTL